MYLSLSVLIKVFFCSISESEMLCHPAENYIKVSVKRILWAMLLNFRIPFKIAWVDILVLIFNKEARSFRFLLPLK